MAQSYNLIFLADALYNLQENKITHSERSQEFPASYFHDGVVPSRLLVILQAAGGAGGGGYDKIGGGGGGAGAAVVAVVQIPPGDKIVIEVPARPNFGTTDYLDTYYGLDSYAGVDKIRAGQATIFQYQTYAQNP